MDVGTDGGQRGVSATALRAAGIGLVAASWLSGALFGAYIVAFYLGAMPAQALGRWNRTLPALYEAGHPGATIGIGVHFAVGAILLLLGPIQLVRPFRDRFRAAHRWMGRVYVGAAALAGAGGLIFILLRGTVGGAVMNIGFGLYSLLMVVAALQTYRHARAGRFDQHRAWGIRLFALVIGSWLYRMEYGFWLPLTGKLGHAHNFSGGFDQVMAFFFYVPNLILAEIFLRSRHGAGPVGRVAGAIVLVAATLIVLAGTWYFAVGYWLPGIMGRA
ncbi:DUF2306 domain-containing protein [Sphingomonas sp. ASY06-1R]|uniref:DUF2306 domain-containing protein n=1 Tax=Sphingomonas sp. ASY06-1R TaxID=3445771 RepID=UPI003FA2A852